MEDSQWYRRAAQPSSSAASKQRRSGYEPSDTETDWLESPWRETSHNNGDLDSDQGPKIVMPRNTSPLRFSRRHHSSRFEHEVSSPPTKVTTSVASPARRRRSSSKSPYKPVRIDDGAGAALSPPMGFQYKRNISPMSRPERDSHVSPYKPRLDERKLDRNDFAGSTRKQNHRTLSRDGNGAHPVQLLEVDRVVGEKTNYRRRSATAPRLRKNDYGNMLQREESAPSPLPNMVRKHKEAVNHVKTPSVGELNEMIAKAKLSVGLQDNAPVLESIESISPGDIFFSRDHTALALQKNVLPKNNGSERHFAPKPRMISSGDAAAHQRFKVNDTFDLNPGNTPSRTGFSQTTISSSSAMSGKNSGKLSNKSSKMSDTSGRTTESMRKFTANRRKSQSSPWLACMRKGPCRTSKSPEHRPFDETMFIDKAFVVENLRQFWADKHQPGSLNGFTCHKQEAQLLKQIVSHDVCPHILLKGPTGSGKRALTMALLREIYGDDCWNISHDLRCFQIQERRPMQVVVPLTFSTHHVELNVNLEANAKYALIGLVKEISSQYAVPPEVSNVNFRPEYKVIVLYEVDKAEQSTQHLMKWIMDCYTESCKLILCCEDDADILESVKTRCKVMKVDALVTHEIMEVLMQIARKEDFDLPTTFATKIATKSKQNLRKAIMALEACKAHNYPFDDDQPVPIGWEEVLDELAADILADPSPTRLSYIREKFQKLLLDFVHPKLILQKLVEQFLKRVETSSKRQLYYWHAYYNKKLPAGTSAILKLEEFVAKFISIYRKSSSNRQYI
ncbi:hypothetical protein F2P56_026564 [Juglans regia]|uniref:Replication factor C subunit 3-like n=2 Tax=Juglans regia TaxID=51240 RepID=A0A833TSF7_JUGRE|nr:hypothetical protein F2P56_026564 [Juglans regia]